MFGSEVAWTDPKVLDVGSAGFAPNNDDFGDVSTGFTVPKRLALGEVSTGLTGAPKRLDLGEADSTGFTGAAKILDFGEASAGLLGAAPKILDCLPKIAEDVSVGDLLGAPKIELIGSTVPVGADGPPKVKLVSVVPGGLASNNDTDSLGFPNILETSFFLESVPKMLPGPKIDDETLFFGLSASLPDESLSSAPGANPSSSMKSASLTLDGSPHTKPPVGGAGAVSGLGAAKTTCFGLAGFSGACLGLAGLRGTNGLGDSAPCLGLAGLRGTNRLFRGEPVDCAIEAIVRFGEGATADRGESETKSGSVRVGLATDWSAGVTGFPTSGAAGTAGVPGAEGAA